MSAAFDFDELDSFIPGAIGEPGQRVFYLQARQGHRVLALRLEKEQVGMLGRYLGQLAGALGVTEPERDIAGLIEPVTAEFVVGTISVGVDEAKGMIHVTTEELSSDEIELSLPEDVTEADIEELLEAEDGSPGAQATFALRAGQAAAFAEAADELISAGRPPCRLCGRPIGPEGHDCPRWN